MNEVKRPSVFPTKNPVDTANSNQAAPQTVAPNYGVSPGEQAAIDEMKRRNEKIMREHAERMAKEKQETETQEVILAPAAISTPVNIEPPKGYRPPKEPSMAPYDLLELPSEGKIYPQKKNRFKVAYLNASDENILTSANILESGEWLDILLSRKILEDIQPSELHVGDRNAILIWLRATGYGPLYPINVVNPRTGKVIMDPITNKPYEHEVDLTTLQVKKLGAEPDVEGYFYYKFPNCKSEIKFRLLTCGDVEELDAIEEYEKNVLKLKVTNQVTNRLTRQIVEVDGNRNKDYIEDFIVSSIRVKDSRDFRKYSDSIESGVDLNISVRIPGGESINTFLPLNVHFFWPDFRF